MSFANYLENAILSFFLRNNANAITAPATVYVAVFTADPGEDANTFEVVPGANAYARKAATWDAEVNGVTQNAAEVRFDNMPGVTVTHFGVLDAITAGNALYVGTVTPNEVVGAGDNLVFPPGALTITND